MIERGHSLSECLDLTLAQVAALTTGHLEVEAMTERRAIHAQRLAFWGSDEDLRNHAAEVSGAGNLGGNLNGAADVETALAAFGLKEE